MVPADSDPSDLDDPDAALRRIEERVQRVRDLDSFHFSRREDGRFQCELETPVDELTQEELEEALRALDTLSTALRRRLDELRGD